MWNVFETSVAVISGCAVGLSSRPPARARCFSTRGSVWARSWKWQRERRPGPASYGGGDSIAAALLDEPAPVGEDAPLLDASGRRQKARDRVERRLVLERVAPRDAAQQPDRVGMAWVVEHLPGGPFLDQLAGVQDPDAIAHLGDHAEVVADEQQRGPELVTQRRDQVEHLGLDGRVERGRRLVEDQQRRLGGERHRDHDALEHPARELVRIAVHDAAGVGDPDLLEHLPGCDRAPRPCCRRRRSRTPRRPGARPGSSGSAPCPAPGRPSRRCSGAACAVRRCSCASTSRPSIAILPSLTRPLRAR